MARGARDWTEDKTFGTVQHKDMAVDIHHIFPQRWCTQNSIDDEHREGIVNKTMLSAHTNRVIGGVAPSSYLMKIESQAGISEEYLDELLRGHLVDPVHLRRDDFDAFFIERREQLCQLIKSVLDKTMQRDISQGAAEEDSSHFESEAFEDEQPEDE